MYRQRLSAPSDMDSSPHLDAKKGVGSWKLLTLDPPTTKWKSKERKHCHMTYTITLANIILPDQFL